MTYETAIEDYSQSIAQDIRLGVDQMWSHWRPQRLVWNAKDQSHSFTVFGGSADFTVTIEVDDPR